MPPDRIWELRVEDILECIERMHAYTRGMSLEDFRADTRTMDAVERNLAVIGEAARQIPDEVAAEYAEIPWHLMREMRDVLVEYFAASPEAIWRTIEQNLPPLVPLLQRMLQSARE
jgi:uncharacterized protein with HEPN domain